MKTGSKEGQDEAVSHLIPRPGFYLDLGANHPVDQNNTHKLRQLGWGGYCFDIRQPPEICENYIVGDVRSLDFKSILGKGRLVSYISFDVDSSTIKALENFPFEEFPFAVMSFEHDLYRQDGQAKKDACIKRLEKENYAILMENVKAKPSLPFEDWWINLDCFDPDIISFRGRELLWQEAVERIRLIPFSMTFRERSSTDQTGGV